ncbi:nucleotidyltransferase family protein [Sphingobium sp. CR2-8]|uniref:nucleotidyltransferase family protein n=1 Tax=Sphingobium sp. CR2-8 TaxID=1306534 RepID=UPI002DBC72FF|nr:nucleotidyltransferase family protein [Sphingobium sp. CR2-8]MEC3910950.1 nucleotidyltransferase family protein [Sphingobium sp. CR2-8]
MTATAAQAETVRRIAQDHPVAGPMLDRWALLGLPDAWLSGSLLAQAWWNIRFGLPPLHGIDDADIIYFDPVDLSDNAEARAAAHVGQVFADLPIRLDVKNQARVHLWYPDRFGVPIAPYRSARDATATFPTTASAVAINEVALSAPFGLDDFLAPVVRANATLIDRAFYEHKAARWATCWPDLPILPWSEAARPRSVG